jgi:hypothetical protein
MSMKSQVHSREVIYFEQTLLWNIASKSVQVR